MLSGMTEPQFGGTEGAPPPPGQYPPPPNYPMPPQYPAPGGYVTPPRRSVGIPSRVNRCRISPRSSPGLLQLLGLFGLVGIGRIYLGDTKLGIIQLVVGLLTCTIGAVVWGIIDAIMILTDKVRDPQGRPLRDGT